MKMHQEIRKREVKKIAWKT